MFTAARSITMASFPCVHHIEVGSVNGAEAVHILTSKFLFKLKAVRQTQVASQWLLVKNNARFLVTNLNSLDAIAIKNDSFVVNWSASEHCTELQTTPIKDSVFNVAFQVKNIDSCIERLNTQGVTFIKPLHTVGDSEGFIRTCVIKGCVGDIHHTLIERQSYTGTFLPGFTPVLCEKEESEDTTSDSMLDSFDHVALAVKMNTSMTVIDWYEKCFGMKRFFINREEDELEGLLLATSDVGLRLRAIEYWKCSEVGLMASEEMGIESKLSMVIAEGLPPVPGSSEENQVESWIRQHGGPGIQHVAFTSSNIKTAVRNLRQSGAPFANPPPPAYYSEIGRLGDIKWAGEDVDDLRNNGILIDTEANGIHDSTDYLDGNPVLESYLLQIFTRPVFPSDPFFLEIIQRKGATGFGSGNIAALYRSVQAYIVGEKSI